MNGQERSEADQAGTESRASSGTARYGPMVSWRANGVEFEVCLAGAVVSKPPCMDLLRVAR